MEIFDLVVDIFMVVGAFAPFAVYEKWREVAATPKQSENG